MIVEVQYHVKSKNRRSLNDYERTTLLIPLKYHYQIRENMGGSLVGCSQLILTRWFYSIRPRLPRLSGGYGFRLLI